MTNLGGHDLETILEAFDAADGDPAPHAFVAYTIKGYGLPLAGHKDNHAGLMNPTQLATLPAAGAACRRARSGSRSPGSTTSRA